MFTKYVNLSKDLGNNTGGGDEIKRTAGEY